MTTPPAPTTTGLDARGLPGGYAFKADWEITPREARDQLALGKALLLDCRRVEEHATTRIEGSVLIPMNEIPRRADELEADDGSKDRPIIVHCHRGMRSLQVTATLRGLGFTNVKSLAGGIDLWSIDIDPTVKRY